MRTLISSVFTLFSCLLLSRQLVEGARTDALSSLSRSPALKTRQHPIPNEEVMTMLRHRGGKKSASEPSVTLAPPQGFLANVKAASILSVAGASWAILRNSDVRTWFEDLSPIHKYFPLSRHQVLIFLSWLMNQIAVRVPGRSDGKSWKETISIRFFTPSAYAFAIWAPIFLGELIISFYQLFSSKLAPDLQPYLAKLAPALAQAFTAQSLWCIAFRPWAGTMQSVPTVLLALTALGLSRVHTVLREAVNAGVMRPIDYIIVHVPLSLHFGWILAATLVNLNGWVAVSKLRTGDKLGLALASVNIAFTLGSKITIDTGDPIISLVVAWALYAVADDLRPGKSILRKNNSVGAEALDSLETTALVSAELAALVSLLVGLYKLGLKVRLWQEGDPMKLLNYSLDALRALLA